jgi:cell shape-determining protein MreD
MASAFREIKSRFLESVPILLLFFISLNGNSIIDLNYFSINIHYIFVYYWVLKSPQILGYGFIFLSGIITDVIFGLPIGSNSLILLIIASFATYIRVVTIKINLFSDWLSFIPVLIIANISHFTVLYLMNYPIEYLDFFMNSIFTFIFYPVLWIIFEALINFTNIGLHD